MKPLKVLAIEDSPSDYELMVATLERAAFDVSARRIDRNSEFDDAVEDDGYDIVLCDHGLPDLDVPEVIAKLRSAGNDVPVIVVTGSMNDEDAVTLVKLGAHDYLLKDRLARLPASVEAALAQRDLLKEQKVSVERMQRLSGMAYALRTIGTAISASMDIKVTLSVLLDHAVQLLEVDAAGVLLLNPQRRILEYGQGRGFVTDGFTKTRLRLGQGIAGAALTRLETLVSNDLTNDDPPFSRMEFANDEGFTSVVAIPLVAKGQALGVLQVFGKRPFALSAEREEALEALATAAAIAVDNARLLTDARRTALELEQTYQDTLEGWASALELRDYETEGHSRRVTGLSEMIGRELGLDEVQLGHLNRGALLHDVGKMAVPDSILLKEGRLTDDEWVIMRRHPEYGHRMVSNILYLKPAAEIVYAHHEKWDGSGYPLGLAGAAIPVGARIFTIADVFDALRSKRPYKDPWPLDRVAAEIEAGSGGHFDPECVTAFLRIDRELLW